MPSPCISQQGELCSAHQLVHSQYLQLLTALAVGLGLNSVLISPPHPPHFDPPPPAKEWQWLSDFTRAVKISEMLNKRLPLPKDCGFSLPKDVQPLDSSEKYQPTVRIVICYERLLDANSRPLLFFSRYSAIIISGLNFDPQRIFGRKPVTF